MIEEWVEYYDDSVGKSYYYNPTTGVTSWDPPLQETAATNNTDNSDSGWTELVDENGATYYFNTITQQVQWDRPANFGSGAGASNNADPKLVLPENWQEVVDGDTVYYYNTVTNETSWDHPGKAAATSSEPSLEELKQLWTEHVDSTTGKTYYQHVHTGETTWDSPFTKKEEGNNGEESNEEKAAEANNDFDLFSAAKLFLPGTQKLTTPATTTTTSSKSTDSGFVAPPSIYGKTNTPSTPTATDPKKANNTNNTTATPPPAKKISFTQPSGSTEATTSNPAVDANKNEASDTLTMILNKLQSIDWLDDRYSTNPTLVAHQLFAAIPLSHCIEMPIMKCLQPFFMKQYSFYHYVGLYFHAIANATPGGAAGNSNGGNNGNTNGNTANSAGNRRNSFLSPQQIEKLLRYQPDAIANPILLTINQMLSSVGNYGNTGTINYNLLVNHPGASANTNPMYQDALQAFQFIQSFMIPAPVTSSGNHNHTNGAFPSYLSTSSAMNTGTHGGNSLANALPGTNSQHFQYYYSLLRLLQQHAPTTSSSPFSTFAHAHAISLPYPLPTGTNESVTSTSNPTTGSTVAGTASSSTSTTTAASTGTTTSTTNTTTKSTANTSTKSTVASLPTIEFIDEIYLQICKQIRYNPSLHSIELGWQLIVLIMIYQLPTFHFFPYFYTFCLRQYMETSQAIHTTTQNMNRRQQEAQLQEKQQQQQEALTAGQSTASNTSTNNAIAILIQEKKDLSHQMTISKSILQCIQMMFQYYSKFYEVIHDNLTSPLTSMMISIPFNSTRKRFPTVYELECCLLQETLRIPVATILPSVYTTTIHSYTSVADVLISFIQSTFSSSTTDEKAKKSSSSTKSVSKEELDFLLSRMQLTVNYYYNTSFLTGGEQGSSAASASQHTLDISLERSSHSSSSNSNAFGQHWSLLWLHEETCALDDRVLDIISSWSLLLPPPEQVLNSWLEGSPAFSTTATGAGTKSHSNHANHASSVLNQHQLLSEVHSFYFVDYFQEYMYGSQYYFQPYLSKQSTTSSHVPTIMASTLTTHSPTSLPKGIIKTHFLLKLYLYYPYYPTPHASNKLSIPNTASTKTTATTSFSSSDATKESKEKEMKEDGKKVGLGGMDGGQGSSSSKAVAMQGIGKEYWLYRQCVYDLLINYYPIAFTDMLFYAALQCQGQYGDYSITKDIPPLNLTGMNGKFLPLIFTPMYIQYTSLGMEYWKGNGNSPGGGKQRKTLTINTNHNTVSHSTAPGPPHTPNHQVGKLKSSLSSANSKAGAMKGSGNSTQLTLSTTTTTGIGAANATGQWTVQDIIPKIIQFYKKLHGLSTEKILHMFLLSIQGKKLFGAKYFYVYHHPISSFMSSSSSAGSGQEMEEYLLAITMKSIVCLDPKTITIVMEHPFDDIYTFKHSFDSFVVIIKSSTPTATATAGGDTVPSTPGKPTSSNSQRNELSSAGPGSSGKMTKYYFQTTNGQAIESVLMAYIQQYKPALLDAFSFPTNHTNNTGTTLQSTTTNSSNPTAGTTESSISTASASA